MNCPGNARAATPIRARIGGSPVQNGFMASMMKSEVRGDISAPLFVRSIRRQGDPDHRQGNKDILKSIIAGKQAANETVHGFVQNGAPRPMKMGTIASPWRYDAAAGDALQSARLRCSTIPHYASSNPENAGSLAEIQVA